MASTGIKVYWPVENAYDQFDSVVHNDKKYPMECPIVKRKENNSYRYYIELNSKCNQFKSLDIDPEDAYCYDDYIQNHCYVKDLVPNILLWLHISK